MYQCGKYKLDGFPLKAFSPIGYNELPLTLLNVLMEVPMRPKLTYYGLVLQKKGNKNPYG